MKEELDNYSECDAIFDIAGITELPRTTLYAQSIGNWDEKIADQIKQKEWRELVFVVENAKAFLKHENY